jgi:hypothetical protein
MASAAPLSLLSCRWRALLARGVVCSHRRRTSSLCNAAMISSGPRSTGSRVVVRARPAVDRHSGGMVLHYSWNSTYIPLIRCADLVQQLCVSTAPPIEAAAARTPWQRLRLQLHRRRSLQQREAHARHEQCSACSLYGHSIRPPIQTPAPHSQGIDCRGHPHALAAWVPAAQNDSDQQQTNTVCGGSMGRSAKGLGCVCAGMCRLMNVSVQLLGNPANAATPRTNPNESPPPPRIRNIAYPRAMCIVKRECSLYMRAPCPAVPAASHSPEPPRDLLVLRPPLP